MVMAVPCHHLIPREDPEPRKVPPFTAELLHIRRKRPRPIPPFNNDGQGRRGQAVESSYYLPLANSFLNEGG
jgi:hypothetical protein